MKSKIPLLNNRIVKQFNNYIRRTTAIERATMQAQNTLVRRLVNNNRNIPSVVIPILPIQTTISNSSSTLYILLRKHNDDDDSFNDVVYKFNEIDSTWTLLGPVNFGPFAGSSGGGIRYQKDESIASLWNDGANDMAVYKTKIDKLNWDFILGYPTEDGNFLDITMVSKDTNGNYWGIWRDHTGDTLSEIVFSTDGITWESKYTSTSFDYTFKSIACHETIAGIVIVYGYKINNEAIIITTIDSGDSFNEISIGFIAQSTVFSSFLVKFDKDTAYILIDADSHHDASAFVNGNQYIKVFNSDPPYTSWNEVTLATFSRLYGQRNSILTFNPQGDKIFSIFQLNVHRENRTIQVDIALGARPPAGAWFSINGIVYTYIDGPGSGTNIDRRTNFADDTNRALHEIPPSPFTVGNYFNGDDPPGIYLGVFDGDFDSLYPVASGGGFTIIQTGLVGTTPNAFTGTAIGQQLFHFDSITYVIDSIIYDVSYWFPPESYGYTDGFTTGPVENINIDKIWYKSNTGWIEIPLPIAPISPGPYDGSLPPLMMGLIYKENTDTLYVNVFDSDLTPHVYKLISPLTNIVWEDVSGILAGDNTLSITTSCAIWEVPD